MLQQSSRLLCRMLAAGTMTPQLAAAPLLHVASAIPAACTASTPAAGAVAALGLFRQYASTPGASSGNGDKEENLLVAGSWGTEADAKWAAWREKNK